MPKLGFILMEALLALNLLAISVIGTFSWLLYSMNVQQQIYFQTVTTEQLRGLVILLRTFPNDKEQVIESWKRNNKRILPSYFIWQIEYMPEITVRAEWPASVGNVWRCHAERTARYSCLSLKGRY